MDNSVVIVEVRDEGGIRGLNGNGKNTVKKRFNVYLFCYYTHVIHCQAQ